jgi:CRP-like cAMP-binding protein
MSTSYHRHQAKQRRDSFCAASDGQIDGDVDPEAAHRDAHVLRILRSAEKRAPRDIETLVRVLKRLDFFAEQDLTLLRVCCQTMTYRRYGAGMSIFEREDASTHMMVVWNGCAELTKQAVVESHIDDITDSRPKASDVRQVGQLVHRGEAIGLEEVVKDLPRPNFCTAAARIGCLVLLVERQAYLDAHAAAVADRVAADVRFLKTFYSLPRLDLFDSSGVWGTGEALHELVVHKMQMISVSGKTVITMQGKPADGLYFIRRGRCEVRRRRGGNTAANKQNQMYYGLMKKVLAAVDSVDAHMSKHNDFFATTEFSSRNEAGAANDGAGIEMGVGMLEMGDWFGGESTLRDSSAGSEGVPFLYTISSLEPTTLLMIPRSSLFHLQTRSLEAVRNSLVEWIERLPQGCMKDVAYAKYKEDVLKQVLSSKRARALRGEAIDRM